MTKQLLGCVSTELSSHFIFPLNAKPSGKINFPTGLVTTRQHGVPCVILYEMVAWQKHIATLIKYLLTYRRRVIRFRFIFFPFLATFCLADRRFWLNPENFSPYSPCCVICLLFAFEMVSVSRKYIPCNCVIKRPIRRCELVKAFNRLSIIISCGISK